MKRLYLLVIAFCMTLYAFADKTYLLKSPDGKLVSRILIGKKVCYDLDIDNTRVLLASPISMATSDNQIWGQDPRVKKVVTKSVNDVINSPFYRSHSITDCFNSTTIYFKGDYAIEFRAYNNGFAYRFLNETNKPFEVVSEEVRYNFAKDYPITLPYVNGGTDEDIHSQFDNSFENIYTKTTLSKLNKKRLAFLPLVVNVDNYKLGILEADLNSFPGLYLKSSDTDYSLIGVHPAYPAEVKQGGHNNLQLLVQRSENYIAKVNGKRSFPWRLVTIARNDKDLANSTLVYQLAEPSRLTDISWIKPGKVAWDWWNDWNLSGVDFKSGINNETYKYYIDFAADKGIEYVILDEGWAENMQADLFKIVKEIDLSELARYSKEKNVGLILWAGFYAFQRDMETICKHYSEMGIKGFKIDFMNRDDQVMTDFIYKAAETCAKYNLIVDFHGMYKPSGLNRTFPNVINVEGVHGLEQLKWSPTTLDQVTYDVELPFLRQMAGPMDYTQGAMRNAAKGNYYPSNSEPMSMGTRCHQLSLYVTFDSPLNMLCDSPSNYLKEPECTDFIARIPTVWDETIVLQGEIGEYIVTARKKGNTWYVGGTTNWQPRDLVIDSSFLTNEQYTYVLFKDGVNADRKGTDYNKTQGEFSKGEAINIHLAPGGGFAMELIER